MATLRTIGATSLLTALACAGSAVATSPTPATTTTTTVGPATTVPAPPGSETDVVYPTVAPFTAPTTTLLNDPNTTTTTTTLSPAAGAPPVTSVALSPEEAAVVQALWEARIVLVDALVDPDAPGLDNRLDATYARSGQARGIVEDLREEFRTLGYRAVVVADPPSHLQIEALEFYAEPFTHVDVVACNFDSSVLIELAGAPDGSDLIVNDEIGTTRIRFTLLPEEGRWQLWHALTLSDTAIGVTKCAAG